MWPSSGKTLVAVSSMGAMMVVAPFVLGQYATEVAFAVDEEPVGAFAPHGPDPVPFTNCARHPG